MAPVPINRTSNSGMPSSRNRHTTDGLPICNKCDKVGHIARNCKAGGLLHHFPQCPQYNSYFRPDMQHQPPRVPSTIHMFALPSNIKCVSTIFKSVTMLQHSFLNKGVPLPIHFNQSRETSSSFLIPGQLGSQLLLNLQRYKMSRKKLYV
jgi:hypothetical protein